MKREIGQLIPATRTGKVNLMLQIDMNGILKASESLGDRAVQWKPNIGNLLQISPL